MHFHVLGPTARFPYSPTRKYTPPDAVLEACRAMHDALGIDRGLVVHANTHGFDNGVDLDAVAQTHGRYLAVVRLDERASAEGCRSLHRAGARGVRFAFNPQHGGALDRAVSIMSCAASRVSAGSSGCTSRARRGRSSSPGSPASRRRC
jgi:predicted TIM-barrel fold metal-dependent hydrolase